MFPNDLAGFVGGVDEVDYQEDSEEVQKIKVSEYIASYMYQLFTKLLTNTEFPLLLIYTVYVQTILINKVCTF